MEPSAAGDTQHLFVYGSLVQPTTLDEVLGHRHLGERLEARLADFRRVLTPGHAYPFIVAAAGESVDGVLLMDLSPYDLQVLDRYEEVESGVYRRELVEVEAWGCGARPIYVRADTYVAGPTLHTSTAS
ncbi:MAG: gamma-glutamylcyclotransferase [Chloroflexi bacterium]|nr:gamma-glutamylcyclotransferase [Chloroflexota bacterium]MBV9897328.1 gamma-glutamylcyclotransferase [Chloroflexota bacterium]